MKLLLDQGLPRSAADLLRGLQHDAVHIAELGKPHADDAEILKIASQQGRAVVTLDADFHLLLARKRASGPSVIRVRIEGLKAPKLVGLLAKVLRECEADLAAGAAVSVEPARVRVHRLPLGRRPA